MKKQRWSKKIVWSDHALERLSERFAARGGFVQSISERAERRLNEGYYEEYYEFDRRKHRGRRKGTRINVVVRSRFRSEDVFLVLRLGSDSLYDVCSVLTRQQYDFNRRHIWRIKSLPKKKPERGKPLTSNPFAELLGERGHAEDA